MRHQTIIKTCRLRVAAGLCISSLHDGNLNHEFVFRRRVLTTLAYRRRRGAYHAAINKWNCSDNPSSSSPRLVFRNDSETNRLTSIRLGIIGFTPPRLRSSDHTTQLAQNLSS